MPETILIVDNDPVQTHMAETMIRDKLHYQVATASSTQDAIRRVLEGESPQPDLIVLDLTMPEMEGLQLIQKLRAANASVCIVVLTRYGNPSYATRVIQAGATDFLTKPVEMERFRLTVQHCLKAKRMSHYIDWLERKIAGHVDFSDVIGESAEHQKTLIAAKQAARAKTPVWLEGEAGCGKETLARAVHGGSDRAGRPFIVVHCQMLPDHLGEAMLFGQEKIALPERRHFTLGKLREAEGGTLLLKEIGALKPAWQKRLLAMIEKKTVTPLGSHATIPADVRVMCTSSEQLAPLVAQDKFDGALYSYLRANPVTIAPLKHRQGDIARLAEHFLCLYAASENKHVKAISPSTMKWLEAQESPGNVRQLAHVIWRAVALCEKDMLEIYDVQPHEKSRSVYSLDGYDHTDLPPFMDGHGQVKKLKSLEEEAIRFALSHANGCMTRAARSLGIGRSTLYRKLNELEPDGYSSRANQTTRPTMKLSSSDLS